MTIAPVNNAQIVAVATTAGMDLSGHLDQIRELPGEIVTREYSVFGGGGYKRQAGGQKAGMFGFTGFFDPAVGGTVETFTLATLGQTTGVAVAMPTSGTSIAEGDFAHFGTGVHSVQSFQLPVDDLGRISLDFATHSGFARGTVGAPLTSRSSTFTGTAQAVTGPTATQKMWALLLVTAASGTNLAVKLQSDDGAGFGSATDRITFSTVSATGHQLSSVAGNLSTETHWRVTATIGSGSFTYAVYFGIGL